MIAIRSLGTATPRRYVTGPQAYKFFDSHFDLKSEERALYRRLLVEGPIRGRYLALKRDEQICEMSSDQQHERFAAAAVGLATRAAKDAMAAAGVRAADVAALTVSTCTGYLCPGLSSYVAQELGLGQHVHSADVVGMGCGSAIPNLRLAAGTLALDSLGARVVLAVSVEVCSATIFMGDDPGLIVSNCLFGDGAAAAVLGATDGKIGTDPVFARPAVARLVDFEAGLLTRHREELRYRHEQGRLRNVLTKRVPVIGGRASAQVARRLLARHGLTPEQIRWWAVHPGGTTVLAAVQRELGLDDDSLRFSHEVLQKYGNMSSPSVLFVLKRLMERGRPRPGERGVMLAFGAGFSAMGALVEF